MNIEEKEITTNESENIFNEPEVESPIKDLESIINVEEPEVEVTDTTPKEQDLSVESVGEPVETGEVLTTDVYKDEEFENGLVDLTFIELFNLGNRMKNEVEEMKAAKESIEGLLKLDNDISKEVSSAATDAKYKDQKAAMEKFLNDYDSTMVTYLYRLKVLEDVMATYKDKANSTIFLTDQLLLTVDKKLAEIEGIDDEIYINKGLDVKRLTIRKTALNSRGDLAFIDSKSKIPAVVKKIIKESYNGNLFLNISKDLEKVFGPNKFREFLVQLNMINVVISDDPKENPKYIMDDQKWIPACNGFLYHMTKLMVNGSIDGTYIYPKLLFMNLIDIKNGIFDLPIGKDAYIEGVRTLITKYANLI